MCNGLGILANFEEVKVIENNRHHSKIESSNKIDNYIKLELLRDDRLKKGYRIHLDAMDNEEICYYTEKQFLLNNKLNPKIKKLVTEWEKNNQLLIWKSLAKACSNGAYIKGDNNQLNSTIKGGNYQAYSTIKGDNNQSYSTIEGDNYQSWSTIKGDNRQSDSTIKGDNYQMYSTINGDNHQSNSIIKGNNYQIHSTIKGNNDQSLSTIGGKLYLTETTFTKNKKLTKLIEEAGKDLTLEKLINYAVDNKIKV